nr:hypothetical protein [uncultured Mediterraneibacter sp.]
MNDWRDYATKIETAITDMYTEVCVLRTSLQDICSEIREEMRKEVVYRGRIMTEYSIGKRGSGKSTKLIKRAAAENKYILVATHTQARCLFKQAKDMGLDILYPITPNELKAITYPHILDKGILIDELDIVLPLLTGAPVDEITITDHGNVSSLPEGSFRVTDVLEALERINRCGYDEEV